MLSAPGLMRMVTVHLTLTYSISKKKQSILLSAQYVDGVFYSLCGIICTTASLVTEVYVQSKLIRIDDDGNKLDYERAKDITFSQDQSHDQALDKKMRSVPIQRTKSISQNLFSNISKYDQTYEKFKLINKKSDQAPSNP